MSDPAAAGSASLLFHAGIGLRRRGAWALPAGRAAHPPRPPPPGRHRLPARTRITTAAATFALSALLAWRFGASAELPAYVLLAVAGVQLARIDLLHHLLPNRLVLPPAGGRAVLLLAAAAGVRRAPANLLRGAAGAVILFVLYLFLALTSRNGLGMGDVKLAAPLGLYLGYLGWSHLFYGGALGFVAGGIASVVIVLKNRGNKPKEVAYGPSMLAAGLAVILLLP